MAKKSFKSSIQGVIHEPAKIFISTAQNASENIENFLHENSTLIPMGYKKNPAFIETKSKHLQLLITPSLHKKLKLKAAKNNSKSLNSFINEILENAVNTDKNH